MPWVDEDHDRFVNGDHGGMEPGGWIILFIMIIAILLWWFK